MSVKNFIPEWWATTMIRELEKTHTFANLVNRNYEGQIRQAGDTVHIPGIGAIDVNTYAGSVTYQEIEDASTTLEIDQKKYFAFALDDVDKVQANQDLMGPATQEGAYALSDAADIFLASKYTEAGITVTQAALKSSNIISTFAELRQKFSENNVPRNAQINVVLSPAIMAKVGLSDIVFNTDNSSTMANGYMGSFGGFNLFESNNVQNNGSTLDYCMAFTSQAISYAEQLMEMEAIRREGSFSDAIRGLHVYGGKVVRPKQLAVLNLTPAAETTI